MKCTAVIVLAAVGTLLRLARPGMDCVCGARHQRDMTDEGVLPAWRGKNSPEITRDALSSVLENPSATFDDVLGGTAVKGFIGEVSGTRVAVMVFKSDPCTGHLATSVVPSANQLATWGVR